MPTAQPPELCLRKRTPGARSSAYVRRPRTIADNISSGRCCSARSTASATAPFTPSGGATRTERRTVVVAAILIIITVIRRPRCRAECSRRRTNAGAADPGAVSAPSWAVPGCQPIAERAGYRWTRISTRSGEATPASRAAASRGGSGAINSDCQQEAARSSEGALAIDHQIAARTQPESRRLTLPDSVREGRRAVFIPLPGAAVPACAGSAGAWSRAGARARRHSDA